MFRNRVDGFPFEHHEYVRKMKSGLISSLSMTGVPAAILSYGYLHDWLAPVSALAPFSALAFLIVLLQTPGIIEDMRIVCILPYFKKGSGCTRLWATKRPSRSSKITFNKIYQRRKTSPFPCPPNQGKITWVR